jgi:hypothetical protein
MLCSIKKISHNSGGNVFYQLFLSESLLPLGTKEQTHTVSSWQAKEGEQQLGIAAETRSEGSQSTLDIKPAAQLRTQRRGGYPKLGGLVKVCILNLRFSSSILRPGSAVLASKLLCPVVERIVIL